MFTCSICDETFVGCYQTAVFTTLCGHVFHLHCLKTWLNRAKTCPNCRSTVLENQLIKLFLQIDPNARIIWNRQIDDELQSLRKQVKDLQEKEKKNSVFITNLESQLKQWMQKTEQNNNSLQSQKLEIDKYKIHVTQLKEQIGTFNINYFLLEEQKKNLETQLQTEKAKRVSLDKSIYELHSVNAVVIDNLKSEIADLKAEKAYYLNKCQEFENIKSLHNPSTSNIDERLVMTNIEDYILKPQVDKKKIEYCGYDSNLKLSSKKFLLGCIFLIVEDYPHCEDLCSDISMTKLSIIEHGGTVVQSYSSRVTHVICASQKHSIVEQGLKDNKRCVTDYWLSDVIAKQAMLPPWFAHHLPTPFSDNNILPCQHLQIAIADFDVNEYYRVRSMVKLTGAQVINEVSSRTDIVISKRLQGEMVEKAQALKRCIVNVEWLNDILFGAQYCINHPHSPKYQQFNIVNPFSINYDMVSNLMNAWKTPVAYLKNTHVYDLTDSPIDDLNCKKPKLADSNPELIDLTDNDDVNTNDIVITYVSYGKKPYVMFCGFSILEQEALQQILLQLGGVIAKQCNEATHLIMKEPKKTLKFLCCLSTVNQIVNESWLRDSYSELKFKDEMHYTIKEIYDKNEIVCRVPRVLVSALRQNLFRHKIFYITPGILYPPYSRFEEIILSAGGIVEKEIRSINNVQLLTPNTYFVISCSEDLHLVNDFLKINYIIYSSEFIISSIMLQSIQSNSHFISYAAYE
ncbi:PAX-interacting protein 1-like [Daktulosphaira vitifoliae]|uniref:PAX-interacting protein 1-like n=1 Tax=Daktulosphaira vitifoliae TaxID=58002 RepID=UPI0021AAB3DE|nr:PAX-interacting protein 1-like [Daktulosphaira vitifoliae]